MTRTIHPDFADRVAAHQRTGRGALRIPYPIGVCTVPVVARTDLTPFMVRLELNGPDLARFHSYQADDHVKIVFPDEDGTWRRPVRNGNQMLDWPHPMPLTRDYTVRRYTGETLVLDIVLHEGGIAAEWARTAQVGEEVTVAGPPGGKAFPYTHDHYVLAVDSTGLPAAARWLEEAPAGPGVHLVVEVDDPVEHDYPLPSRDGVEIVRLVRDGTGSALAATVSGLAVPDDTFLFAAGEAGDIKPLRTWPKDMASITGYWKRGVAGLERE
ncbi:NADPH-dependent ferric siderophore reductase [Actinosynnema sp. ALI-1.44]|uniref:siderophore-interacting protein n=1 Tax=Actinosynnema sp. ALI-1.44 TaxID=1933779 RepID=UPI00097CB858|nr:siderophore-interacting protein [Actinosynnema sp. ALI-1.44]ONI82851.1 NADPH-dependent ferric siderophore reductase [Actinosynnema sp. ALI-1.44]